MSEDFEANLDEVREMIALMTRVSTQSKRHREANFRAKDFKALAEWERDLTDNYGVPRRAR